jgi:RHS repeat-associated protein
VINGSGTAYTYDGMGERVKKPNKLYWKGVGSTALAETDTTDHNPTRYIFFNGERIARTDPGATTAKYYVADNVGSTALVTDSVGNILNESLFFPYGVERVVMQNDTGNNYKFSGKERDAETGLDDFGARYYDSSLGRFMTPDWDTKPITVPYAKFGDPQTLNLYAYVENGPLNNVDADGHSATPTSDDLISGTTPEGGSYVPCVQVCAAEGNDGTGNLIEYTNYLAIVAEAQQAAVQQAQQNAAVDSLVSAQDAARANPQNQPAGKTTHCNSATYQVCGAMGANMGIFSGYPGWDGRANAVGKKLAESSDWKTVPMDQVQALADKGIVVIASYINPHGDGHLVTVRPEGVKGDNPGPGTGPLLNNVGRTVGVMHYSQVFRKTAEVNFYVQK